MSGPGAMRLVEVVGLTKRLGGRPALDAASFTVEEGEVLGLLGPAGAGKSTCLGCLTGLLIPDGGRVIFDGRDVTGEAPERLARAGIAQATALPRRLCRSTALGVVDHAVRRARHPGLGRLLAGWLSPGVGAAALGLLERVGLAADADRRAGLLAAGPRRRLEVARALAASPRLLLLDEPLAGLSPEEAVGVGELIAGLRRDGLTILLAARRLPAAPGLVDRVVVLDRGAVVAPGRAGLAKSRLPGRGGVPAADAG